MTLPRKPIAFDWNEGNNLKNWEKHRVTQDECEQVFVNKPKMFEDIEHSEKEERMTAYGETNNHRKLTIVFTYRQLLIRVISARDQNKKERIKYEAK
ncbi:MAG: BrnT family toxin [Candidatus Shapirobacteria bacterium]|nr:BrnT family toxin [Candidatus Shapirobacteria bacterium]